MSPAVKFLCGVAVLAALMVLAADPALAQLTHRPFALPGGEAGGAPSGFSGWILGVAAWLNRLMADEVKALHQDGAAMWGLIGLSVAYGVFHAAGPGHGKALIASYLFANERALQRGVVMAFLAAILQAIVAIVLIGAAALAFHATGSGMNRASGFVEVASYIAVAGIGGWLVWRKAGALAAALRLATKSGSVHGALFPDTPWRPALALGAGRFRAESADAGLAAAECGHVHAPDVAQLGAGFSWRGAAATVFAAGVRPCSGAIIVLTFALTQGLFSAGVIATFAMALGTATTTSALAALAVFGKDLAVGLVSRESGRAALLARGLEFVAALCVLAYGLALLALGPSGGG